jgi:uncharacterized protein
MQKQKHKHPDGFRVGKSSAGLGLFATRDYKKGERVIEYAGRLLSEKEADDSNSSYLFEITKKKVIDGAARTNIARYINHSCKPNCEPNIRKGQVFIDAIKRVRAGDEFTYDYGEEYFNDIIKPKGCRCVKHQKA